MSAQRILSAMQTMTEMQRRINEYEDTFQSLLLKIDALEKETRAHQQTLGSIFKKTLCPKCSHYLESKRDGDTVEGHSCATVFLQRCSGIGQ